MSKKSYELTDEEYKTIKEIYPNSTLETIDDGKKGLPNPASTDTEPEVDTSKVLSKEQEEDYQKGYIDYEVKNKESDRISYLEDEIEISEEDLE